MSGKITHAPKDRGHSARMQFWKRESNLPGDLEEMFCHHIEIDGIELPITEPHMEIESIYPTEYIQVKPEIRLHRTYAPGVVAKLTIDLEGFHLEVMLSSWVQEFVEPPKTDEGEAP